MVKNVRAATERIFAKHMSSKEFIDAEIAAEKAQENFNREDKIENLRLQIEKIWRDNTGEELPFLFNRSMMTEEIRDIIKSTFVKPKGRAISMSKRKNHNLSVLLATDLYCNRCVWFDKGSHKLFTQNNFQGFGVPSKNYGSHDGLDYRKFLEHDLRDYILEEYDIKATQVDIKGHLDSVIIARSGNLLDLWMNERFNHFTEYKKNELNEKNARILIKELVSFFELDNPYNHEGEKEAYQAYVENVFFVWYKKLANVNAMARYGLQDRVEYPHDVVPILIGEQGCGKSTFVDSLVDGELRFFCRQSRLNILDNKDELAKLGSRLICEVSELGGVDFKNIERIKDFFTQQSYEIRPAYARDRITIYRRWAGIATTNNGNDLLNDPTGNRRWFPVHVKKIHVNELKQSGIAMRLLSFFMQWSIEMVKGCFDKEGMNVNKYRSLLYMEHEAFFPEKEKQQLKQTQSYVEYEPEYADSIRYFIEHFKDKKFRANDLFLLCYPDANKKGPHIKGHRAFQNYAIKLLKENGFETKVFKNENKKNVRAYYNPEHYEHSNDANSWVYNEINEKHWNGGK